MLLLRLNHVRKTLITAAADVQLTAAAYLVLQYEMQKVCTSQKYLPVIRNVSSIGNIGEVRRSRWVLGISEQTSLQANVVKKPNDFHEMLRVFTEKYR